MVRPRARVGPEWGAARVRGGVIAALGSPPHFGGAGACSGAGVWRGWGAAAVARVAKGGSRGSHGETGYCRSVQDDYSLGDSENRSGRSVPRAAAPAKNHSGH